MAGLAVGLVLAFGAGALISAVSFDLFEEGQRIGGPGTVAIGLAAGALTYFGLDRLVGAAGGGERRWRSGHCWTASRSRWCSASGSPPGRASAPACWSRSSSPTSRRRSAPRPICATAGQRPDTIRRLWFAVAVVCTLATVAGFALADAASGDLQAAINGFAAGALLVMLIDSMIPEAARKAGRPAGLLTVVGFAVAAGLS